MNNKIKYSGLLTFTLSIVAFLLDAVSTISTFDLINTLTGTDKTVAMIVACGELAICLVIIVNSLFGIRYLLKPKDNFAATRRGIDGLGCFAIYIAIITAFSLWDLVTYAKENGYDYSIPISSYVIIGLFFVGSLLALVGSSKKLPLSKSIKCGLGLLACLLIFVAYIFVMTTGSNQQMFFWAFSITYLTSIVVLAAFIFFSMEVK